MNRITIHSFKNTLSLVKPTLIRSLSCNSKGFGSPNSDNSNSNNTTPISKQWNLKGLKLEINRQQHRTFKKVGKARGRLTIAEEKYSEIMTNPEPPLELLETCPDVDGIRDEVHSLQKRLHDLTDIEKVLSEIKNNNDENFKELIPRIEKLGISDKPPQRQLRGPKKIKQKTPPAPRMPYAVYNSIDDIEIRVGRTADDNDNLSCNPELRDNNDWWLHASGCPGSHVVIRYTGDDIMSNFRDTVIDAALLAAINSKNKNSNKVTVNLTRCRNVTKPKGAKPGLVQLRGDIMSISINMNAEKDRIDRFKNNSL